MLFIKYPKKTTAAAILSLTLIISSCWAHSDAPLTLQNQLSTETLIQKAVQYAGKQAEKKLKDLLKADFHYAQALYYLDREKAGFMAQERFQLAHDHAIADIRELSTISDDAKRLKKALAARDSWLGGFKRARFKDIPKERGFFG